MTECTNSEGHLFNRWAIEGGAVCSRCGVKLSLGETLAMLCELPALKRIEDAAREWNKAHPNPNGHCDTDDLRGCVTARALKDALLEEQRG